MLEAVKETYKEEEYTRDTSPYILYFQSLNKVFDFTTVDSFADMGCNNGGLIASIYKNYPNTDVAGYDYFEWSKKYADESIKEAITINDLSKPYTFKKQYQIVNCSEVGEHIPKESEGVFLDNLVHATSDTLVLTWSNKKDPGGQHLNPRPKSYIIRQLKKRGFKLWREVTTELSGTLAIKLEGVGHNWWADNVMVFKRGKFAKIASSYFIQGISTDNVSHKKNFNYNGLLQKTLQTSFSELKETIQLAVVTKKELSILRASDGDYFFLRKIAIGSAKPGRRALTVPYDQIPMNLYRSMFWQNDIITTSIEQQERKRWRRFVIADLLEKIASKILKKEVPQIKNGKLAYAIDALSSPFSYFSFLPKIFAYTFSIKRKNVYLKKALEIIDGNNTPLEAVYALISTKWIFKNFKNEIGIIASENKITVIQELMKQDEYRNYLGVESFTDYIAVPEIGAADSVAELSKQIGEQLKVSKAKIFLIGVGSAKIALMPLLKSHTNAVLIDVGGGVDALAGIICQDRPYFAEWVNYKIKNFDYSTIDFMDKGNPARDNVNYKTITV